MTLLSMTTLQQGKQKWIEERYGVANLGRALGEKKTGRKKQRFHKTVKSLKTVAVFNGAEGGTRTLTGVTRYPLKIVCLPVPPPRLWSSLNNRL